MTENVYANGFATMTEIAMVSEIAYGSDFTREGKIDGESEKTKEDKNTRDIDFA